ncbi:MAG: sulfurtransferase [Alicyclobacillus sp.]|nr:sulfurtransferase [Alicyclobacillus sp.]
MTERTSRDETLLRTPAELAKALQEDASALVVFDCRFSLGQPNAGFDAYQCGHIPTAYYLHLEHDLSGPRGTHGGRHPLPDAEVLAAKLAAAGVTEDREVVVYDAGGGMAARAWWLLRYVGLDRVRVLDGGWTAWVAGGFPVETAIPAPRSGQFTARVHSDWVVSTADVEQMVRGERPGLLVDARAANRYRGEMEPIDPVAGHIPGAVNRPWEEGLRPDGTWQPGDWQRQRFESLCSPERPLVMYCGSGVTACANLFALHLAGLPDARLYPGSWSDWCSVPEHPVATGDEAGL